MAYALVFDLGNQPAAQLQSEELAWIEHVPIAGIAPSMQPIGFVSGQNLLVGHEAGGKSSPPLGRVRHALKVLGVRLLEETALVPRLPFRVVVFDGEEAVLKGAAGFSGIDVGVSAAGAIATAPARGPGLAKQGSTRTAVAREAAVLYLVEVTASRAYQNVFGVSRVLGEKVARKQVERRSAGRAIEHLDPEEGFHGYIGVAVQGAGCPVIRIDIRAQVVDEGVGGSSVGRYVEVLDLLADDPGRHRVDIEALHVASDPVCLDQRRPPAHERVCDLDSRKVVRFEIYVCQPAIPEFRQDEAAKQGSWSAGKPLVNADDGAVVLLDLLFPERHLRDQGNIETPFDAHRRPSLAGPKRVFPAAGGVNAARTTVAWA